MIYSSFDGCFKSFIYRSMKLFYLNALDQLLHHIFFAVLMGFLFFFLASLLVHLWFVVDGCKCAIMIACEFDELRGKWALALKCLLWETKEGDY